MKVFNYLSFLVLTIVFSVFAVPSEAASSYVFPAFNVGTLAGGGPAFTNTLNVTNVSPGEYLVFRVTANYESGVTNGHDAFPNSMEMELSDGGTNVFWPLSVASAGATNGDDTNVIAWSGMFPQTSYQGGSNLTIQFADTYSDSGGPYYSTMSNVVVTLYPATSPSQTFNSFNVGTVVGGGSAVTNSLNISGLPPSEYLLARVTANYRSAAFPADAQPDTMAMEMSDGGTNVFWPPSDANVGAVTQDYTNVIAWGGMFTKASIENPTNLIIQFMDTNNNGHASTMSNVVVALYPASTPSATFGPFNVGTVNGGGPTVTNTLNVSSLPHAEYLFARVTANYASGLQPNDAYPNSMEMQLSDGGSNVFWPFSTANFGAIYGDYTNVLVWSGVLPQASYQGGTNLTIQFMDTFSGGYYSTLNNVVVALYPAVNIILTPPQLNITGSGANVVLAWTNTATGFTLESATNLIPPITWSAVSPAPVTVNGQFTVTNSASNSQLFYRLSQ